MSAPPPQSAQSVAPTPALSSIRQPDNQGTSETLAYFGASRSHPITSEDAVFFDYAASSGLPSRDSWVSIEGDNKTRAPASPHAAVASTADSGFGRNKASDPVKPQAAPARSRTLLRLTLLLAITACAAWSSRHVFSSRFLRPSIDATHQLKGGISPAVSSEAEAALSGAPSGAHKPEQPAPSPPGAFPGLQAAGSLGESAAPEEALLKREREQLVASAASLNETWRSVSSLTHRAFAEHYLRVAKGGLRPSDCIYPLRRFVIALEKIDFASDSIAQQRAYLAEMQLLSLVLQAANKRLQFINASLQFAQQAGIGSPLHGLGRRLPDVKKLKQVTTGLKTFRYLDLLLSKQGSAEAAAEAEAGEKAAASQRVPMGAGTPAIPKVLALKLAHAIILLEMEATNDQEVLNLFQDGVAKIRATSSSTSTQPQQRKHQQNQQQQQEQQEQQEQERSAWIPLRTQDQPFPAALFGDLLRMIEEMYEREAVSRLNSRMHVVLLKFLGLARSPRPNKEDRKRTLHTRNRRKPVYRRQQQQQRQQLQQRQQQTATAVTPPAAAATATAAAAGGTAALGGASSVESNDCLGASLSATKDSGQRLPEEQRINEATACIHACMQKPAACPFFTKD
ncbi:hypothetical protein ACSSS7_004047 [Eimeria intestinalis]